MNTRRLRVLLLTIMLLAVTVGTALIAAPSASARPARYHVELKAWIPFASVAAPPAGSPSCLPPRTPVLKSFEGDDHVGYEGGFRALVSYDFLWDGRTISDLDVSTRFGRSTLHVTGPLPFLRCDFSATATESGVVESLGANRFRLGISAGNPLQPGAPKITSQLDVELRSDAEMRVVVRTDKFPSHGFAVDRNGRRIATVVDFDASCAPHGHADLANIGRRLTDFSHEERHAIDLRVEGQHFFGPCGKKRPASLRFPAWEYGTVQTPPASSGSSTFRKGKELTIVPFPSETPPPAHAPAGCGPSPVLRRGS